MTIKAIQTSYKGYRFRSRLEARWAVFFDALGIEYEYEKEGYSLPSGSYLPDFWLPFTHPVHPGAGYWVEIKPIAPTETEESLLTELTMHTGHNAFLLVGNIGVAELRLFKSICIRDMKSLDYWVADARSGHDRRTHLLMTKNPDLRTNEVGQFHPDDYAACLLERDDPQEYEFPFCEIISLIPNYEARRGMFVEAFRAARSARFEHGETPGGRS